MLEIYPERRARAQKCIFSEWLKVPQQENFKMNPKDFEKYMTKKSLLEPDKIVLSSNEAQDSEINDGDSEDNNIIEDSESDREFYGVNKEPINFKLLERSFINAGYIGYGDGINLEGLDQDANWQFEEI